MNEFVEYVRNQFPALNMEDFKTKLTENTKVVACNYAQNAVGTISDISRIITMAHEVGAVTVVDAVHYYASSMIDGLGLRDRGGLVRIGIAPYNTKEEIDRVTDALKQGIVKNPGPEDKALI